MRLRLELVSKLHGSKQLKLQSWNAKYHHWDTYGKIHASASDWREIVGIIQDGARSRGIECDLLDQQREAA